MSTLEIAIKAAILTAAYAYSLFYISKIDEEYFDE